jgi:hypothetical protein
MRFLYPGGVSDCAASGLFWGFPQARKIGPQCVHYATSTSRKRYRETRKTDFQRA